MLFLRCLLAVQLGLTTSVQVLMACPFCSAVSQTLRQEMKQTDAVGIARCTGSQSDSIATFEILTILKGDQLIQPNQQVSINYFGKADPAQKFLVMGIDPPELLWSSPLAISEKASDYIQQVLALPEDDPHARLKFYLQYLDDVDPVLARDVYDEFASASFADMLELKDSYDRRQLLERIADTQVSPDRRRLYLVMLGICGQRADADVLEKMLRSEDPDQRLGLDALIACYISLRGVEGLPLVCELFLSNKQCTYADTYSAIMALRFHGTDGKVIDRQPVIESLRLILDRPELADLVIPDLARWEDWAVMDKMVQLFKEADEKSSWVRVPVINYLRACPLPEAQKLLDELKELDPVAFKRATQFFPVPQPAESESSALPLHQPWNGLASDRPESAESLNSESLNSLESGLVLTGGARLPSAPRPLLEFSDFQPDNSTNLLVSASVLIMLCSTVWLAMWLAISGAGHYPGWLEAVLVRRD
ncbi:MAG: hypothetical protein KF752_18370 [Pirellulaceae bacterium]|nr:hypothetical protein [Pirellulaceae bacterium]